MTSNDAKPTTNSTSVVKANYRCALSPHFTWNPDDIITRWCTVGINSVAFIPTILLNLLIIIAVKRTKKLQTNCNILLSSMAVSDLLVGAASQPLCIISQGFLRGVGSVSEKLCAINSTYELVAFVASVSSLYHLTIIAWERYVAIKKPLWYKTRVTGGLTKRLLAVIWIAAILSISPELLGLFFFTFQSNIRLGVRGILNAPLAITIPLTAYFYLVINIKVRNRPAMLANQVNAIAKAKLEAKTAKTTGILTATLMLCYTPCFFLVFGLFWPAFMDSSYFLWASTLVHLNSLLNPLLYCYRNDGFRNAILGLLRIRDPPVVQPAAVAGRNTARQKNPELAEVVCESAGRICPKPRCNSHGVMGNVIHPAEEKPKNVRPQSSPPILETNTSSDNDKCQLRGLMNSKYQP